MKLFIAQSVDVRMLYYMMMEHVSAQGAVLSGKNMNIKP